MPRSIVGGFQGKTKAFQQSFSSTPAPVLAALFAFHVILGMLYESTIPR